MQKKYRMKRFLIAAAALIPAIAVQAQDPITQTIDIIVENNPGLRGKAALAEADRADRANANVLQDPEVSVSHVWGADGVGNKLSAGISQGFDWPGAYGARSRAASSMSQAAEFQLLADRLDVALGAKEQLYELVYVRQQMDLLRRLEGNLDSLQANIDRGFERGELTILDQRKIRIERYKFNTTLIDLEAREQSIVSALSALAPDASLPLDKVEAYPVEPQLSVDDYMSEITSLDPAYLAAEMQGIAEGDEAHAARLSKYPGFSIGYEFQREMGDKFNGFNLSMTLPFLYGDKGRGAALARRQAADFDRIAAEASARSRIEGSLRECDLWNSQRRAYIDVFGDNQYLVLLSKAYRGGQINVIDYFSEMNYFYETTLQYLEADYRYRCALASLNRYSLLTSGRTDLH